jgi:hypothetical protein
VYGKWSHFITTIDYGCLSLRFNAGNTEEEQEQEQEEQAEEEEGNGRVKKVQKAESTVLLFLCKI